MSSPIAFAGQKPITALGVNQRSSTMRFSIACASSNRGFRRRAALGIVQQRGIAALELPGLEERRPVDIGNQLRDIIGREAARAGEAGLCRRKGVPVDLQRVRARLGERHALLVELRLGVSVGDALVLLARLRHIFDAALVRQRGLRDADRAAGVGHIDGLTAAIHWADFHRRMHAARGRAADEQRRVEAFALQFGGDEAHLVERGRDEAGEADDVHILALGGF